MVREAILLVGGLGTRLRPLTDHSPKPLLPLAGIPCTTHQLLKARAAGITRVVLATSYLAQIFESTYGDGAALGMELIYAVEEKPLGTGGAIANAGKYLEGESSVFIFNGDVISGHSLENQLALHTEKRASVTLHLTEVADARAYGCVPIDSENRVEAFLEKMENPVSNLINAGCYLFNRDVIDSIPIGQVISVERDVFPELLKKEGNVFGFLSQDYWMDLGTPEAFTQTSADFVLGRAKSPAYVHPPAVNRIESALVSPKAIVEDGSYVAPNVSVQGGARVLSSVLLEGSVVETAVSISKSFIGRGVRIGRGAQIVGAAIGDGAIIEPNAVILPGTRIASA